MSKTRLIPSWVGSIIFRAVEAYGPAIALLIPSPAVSAIVLKLFSRVGQIIKAISDANPQNGEQVEAVVREFVSEDAIPLADNTIDEVISKIKNEKTRLGLTLLAEPVVDTARIFADDNPANAEQAEDILDRFITKTEVQEYFINNLTTPLLSSVVKDPFLLDVLLELFIQGIEQGAIELANIDVFVEAREQAQLKAA